MMDTPFKLLGMLIVLTMILVSAFNLINTFQQYSTIRLLASDLDNLGNVMKSLKEISDTGSWRTVNLKVPENYSLFFNNLTDNLEVHGSEEFNITVNNDLLYSLNISVGNHAIQLYYGEIPFENLKNETVVFT